jgi:hypothetical protein
VTLPKLYSTVLNEDAVLNDIHNLFEKGLDYHDNDNMCMVYMKL